MTLAQTDTSARTQRVRFCSRCGALSEQEATQTPLPGHSRVCFECGMGVVLSCPREALPKGGAAFLIVDDQLCIRAVSEAAEKMLGTEGELLQTLLLSSISSSIGDDELRRRVVRAARGAREVVTVPIYAANPEARKLGSLEARIANCGPPRATLIVVESPAGALPPLAAEAL